MHDMSVMHRDLKCANVFLNKDGTVKLGDMNVSKVANNCGLNYTQTGTPYYASPEIWQDKPYDVKSDVWSLGCVLYEMLALKPPFQAEDMSQLYKKVVRGKFAKIPTMYSNDIWLIVQAMLQVNPNSRPDCKTLMSYPSFQKMNKDLFPDLYETGDSLFEDRNKLLKTIYVPKNIMNVSDRLPLPTYENSRANRKKPHLYSKSIALD